MFATQIPDVGGWVQWVTGMMLQWILPLALLVGLAFAIGAIGWSAMWKIYSWATSATGRWFNWATPGDVFWSAMKIMMIVIGAALIAPLVVAWVASMLGYHDAQTIVPSGVVTSGKVTSITPSSDVTVIKRGGCETVELSPGKWHDFRMESGRSPRLRVPNDSPITKIWASADGGRTVRCFEKGSDTFYNPPASFSVAVDCLGVVTISDP